jgi:multicomponent Na+:H+ antiporter subunit B
VPSLILSTAARYLLPLLLLFSVFLLLRGHDEPGGGFVGGLVGASAFVLVGIATGIDRARRLLRLDPRSVLAAGLLTAVASGLPGVLLGRPLLTGWWIMLPVPGGAKVGTPLLFDMAVYLVVLGAVLTIVFTLMEE